MLLHCDRPRRLAGLILISAALVMTVAGLTLFVDQLRGIGFLLYWLGCYALTGLAMLIALLDAWLIRERARRERAALKATSFDKLPSPTVRPTPDDR